MRLERLPKFAFSEVRHDDELSSLTFGKFFLFLVDLCWFPNILLPWLCRMKLAECGLRGQGAFRPLSAVFSVFH
jgi:hypothetical protein